jgi:hypothetical protein
MGNLQVRFLEGWAPEMGKRQPQTVLTGWLVEILPRGFLAITSKPSRVARPARSADGLIGPARAFAR